jgi:hypothetical protein
MSDTPNTADLGELVARLRAIAKAKFEQNRSFGRRGKEWALEAEIEHQAADLLTAQQREIEVLRASSSPTFEDMYALAISERDAAEAKAEALEKERDEARALAGLGCDANAGAEHDPMSQGRYTFCTKCGETITQPDLRERCRKAEAEVAELRAQLSAAATRAEQAQKLLSEFERAIETAHGVGPLLPKHQSEILRRPIKKLRAQAKGKT